MTASSPSPSQRLRDAAIKVDAPMTVLPPAEVARVRRVVEERYTEPGSTGRLSARFVKATRVEDNDGWERIGPMLRNRPVIVFFDLEEDATMLRFSSAFDFGLSLVEAFGVSFYVADQATTFVLGVTDDGHVVGVGEAAGWLAKSVR
ncbi:MAG: hypothetical protein H0W72_13495 [Planctomycetes bacterium]|nr:hypothetical protein [Planctomycetota bacterium]